MDKLILNSFPAQISPTQVTLPYIEFSSWEESTEAKDNHFKDYHSWRFETDRQQIRLVLLAGPTRPPDASEDVFELGRFWRIGTLLIENSISQYLAGTGMRVMPGHFENIALRQATGSPHEMIQLYTGVSFRARRPFRDDPLGFTVSFQWEARAQFEESLSSDSLLAICAGMPVLYQPRRAATGELAQFENRFIGKVKHVPGGDTVEVQCKDNVPRQVPRRDLWLEASPATMREYERQVGGSVGSTSVWRRIQELSMVLTNDNRRNPAVLRDRLDAIRAVLAGSDSPSREELVIPFFSFAQGTATLSLSPLQVEVTPTW